MNQHILLLGGIIIDEYIVVNEFPARGEDTIITDSFHKVGGCAINVAMTLKNLGLKPQIASVLGMDERGKEINDYLLDHGLSRACIQMTPNKKTGYCISILEDSGERTFLTYKGCEAEFSFDIIREDILKETSFLFVTGYYLLDDNFAGTIIQYIQKAKDLGIKILFDPGSLVSKIDRHILLSMMNLADMITPNEGELEKIIVLLNIKKENFSSWLFKKGVRWLVEKKGKLGVNLWDNSSGKQMFIPSYKVSCIDTSGAGDSFAGGLIYGLLQGYDMQKSIKLASACGAFTTTFMGPHKNFTLKDILKIVGES
ncbi:carbohydrate kinase family protein [Neobacillus sp. YIM B02564]|uniref:Carbohydrate kinase family protein n=1 Tax=Neobacillus paridis TaxID=2803862 RepID=A0ABS1TRR2_9BACI|nr:carbohydrate kinase family protein [Neobacillus paridis]MBL4953263.1 carbohydrate kinase family protein [Neobacillus paridis]